MLTRREASVMKGSKWAWIAAAGVLLSASIASPCRAQPCGGMEDLGTLGGGFLSVARGVSADGRVVVGGSWSQPGGEQRAFRWTAEGGMQNLGTLGGDYSEAQAVSGDGSVVVGVSRNAAGETRAFRWTAAGGMRSLGTLGGDFSEAHAVSADGSVVVGSSSPSFGPTRAFRWTAAGGMSAILNTLGGSRAEARGVSADGAVVVGWARNGADRSRAFRWTSAGGMEDLGSLGGQLFFEVSVSANGEVVAGGATDAAGAERAFRWTAEDGMQLIPNTLGGSRELAFGVSGDGSFIVGRATGESGPERAFRWTAAGGMQDLGSLPGGSVAAAEGVSMDGSVVVGGATDSLGRGRAFRWEGCATDTDGDGLLDDWEREGVPYIDAAGIPRRFVLDADGDGLSDANWQHKDLFVEIDALPGMMISAAARQMVIDAFADAPVANPSGVDGITLHLQVSDAALVSLTPWATDTNDWAPEFDALKQRHFGAGTAEERAAKARAFRYAICADTIDDGSLGTAELPGNDFFITLGELGTPATVEQEAGTFMHELGHTLGLRHGGCDDIIGKPNYVSVMNYALTEPLPFSAGFWRLDFSRETIPALDECCLAEPAGVQSTQYTHVEMPYGVDDGAGGRLIRCVRLDGSATDWNGNGLATETNVPQDLNYLGNGAPFAGVDLPSFAPPDGMPGHDDWAHLQLGIGTTGDFVDFVHETVPENEPTAEMVAWMHANLIGDGPPPPACPADWDGNRIVNSADVGAFLTSYFHDLTHGTLNADFDANGITNSADVGAYLTEYIASLGECP